MAQFKKEAIKEAIDSSALEVFAKRGYKKTTVKAVADTAGISVGNVYHYYKKKDEIYYALVTDGFIDEIRQVISDKISMKPEGEKLYSFIVENKELFLILFNGSEGTKYEHAVTEVIDEAAQLYCDLYFANVTHNDYELYRMMYRGHFNLIKELLLNSESDTLREQLVKIDTYHKTGMIAMIKLIGEGKNEKNDI